MRGQLLTDFLFFLFVLVHLGRSDMTDGLQILIGALRRGRSTWSSNDHARIRSAFLMPDGSGVVPVIAGAFEDEADALRIR